MNAVSAGMMTATATDTRNQTESGSSQARALLSFPSHCRELRTAHICFPLRSFLSSDRRRSFSPSLFHHLFEVGRFRYPRFITCFPRGNSASHLDAVFQLRLCLQAFFSSGMRFSSSSLSRYRQACESFQSTCLSILSNHLIGFD